MPISEKLVKISANPSTGPAITVSSHRNPATRTVYHQRPRTSRELPRNASRIRLFSNRTSCWTNCQSTYLRIAIGIPIKVSAIAITASVASSWPNATRQNRGSIAR